MENENINIKINKIALIRLLSAVKPKDKDEELEKKELGQYVYSPTLTLFSDDDKDVFRFYWDIENLAKLSCEELIELYNKYNNVDDEIEILK